MKRKIKKNVKGLANKKKEKGGNDDSIVDCGWEFMKCMWPRNQAHEHVDMKTYFLSATMADWLPPVVTGHLPHWFLKHPAK